MGLVISLELFKKHVEKAFKDKVGGALCAFHSDLVDNSPVKSGHLRASNQVGVGSEPSAIPGALDTAGTRTKDAGQAVINAAVKFGSTPLLVFANTAEYAGLIEFGGSGKSARPFYRACYMGLKDRLAK